MAKAKPQAKAIPTSKAKKAYNERIRDLGRMYQRIVDLGRMYGLLDELAARTHSLRPRLLSEFSATGVYFFYECGEHRLQGSNRIVRVGKSTVLCSRLRDHKIKSASVFRKLVRLALEEENKNKNPPKKLSKKQLDESVTETLGNMWVLCLPIEGKTLRDSIEHDAIALLSNYIERNAIALLSNYNKNKSKLQIDPPSQSWLGLSSPEEKVQISGLWNEIYVGHEEYDSNFLDELKKLIRSL